MIDPHLATSLKNVAQVAEPIARPDDRVPDGAKFARRSVLKSLAAAVGLAPSLRCIAQQAETADSPAAPSPKPSPRWYGFNLLEYFSTDPDWMKYFPYKNDGQFLEDDFRWMRDWGFNFARLPMDYRFWTAPDDFTKINEKQVEPIDRAVRLGQQYGVHVNISLHRAPGFCILDDLDAALTGIHVTPEKTSFYHDSHTLNGFLDQWTFFAHRYQGISSADLSFNLVNEPVYRATAAEKDQLAENYKGQPQAVIDRQIAALGAMQYARVARAAVDAIRAVDANRPIVVDGNEVAAKPVDGLLDAGVIQSPHSYYPPELTTFKAEWARQWLDRTDPPDWPLTDREGRVIADRNAMVKTFQPWREIVQQGVPIHFGEIGCYKHTPPEVVLAWFDDMLDVIRELCSGWALWNFRGPFGILDTQRPGTQYENWHGHQLDRPLLELLQEKMKA